MSPQNFGASPTHLHLPKLIELDAFTDLRRLLPGAMTHVCDVLQENIDSQVTWASCWAAVDGVRTQVTWFSYVLGATRVFCAYSGSGTFLRFVAVPLTEAVADALGDLAMQHGEV